MNRSAKAAMGLALLVVMTTLGGACLGTKRVAGDSRHISISCQEFMDQNDIKREAEVAVGDLLKLTLCSNPTTGFRWEQVGIGDRTVVEEVGHQFQMPSSRALVGLAGNELWTLKALKKGTTSVSLDYGRPWEGGERGEWTLELTVVVK